MLLRKNVVRLLVEEVGPAEASRILEVSRQTIWRWCYKGGMPSQSANNNATVALDHIARKAAGAAASAKEGE